VIAGNALSGFDAGVIIALGARDNQVRGNRIGLNAAGDPLPNDFGVVVFLGGQQNSIGGERPTDACDGPCNLISGNNVYGVLLQDTNTSGNRVQGNFVGVAADGMRPIPNGFSGVAALNGPSQNLIGGGRAGSVCAQTCNLIGGNIDNGVMLSGAGTAANTVVGNYIGLNRLGTAALPNQLSGIEISSGASQNVIGGERAPGPCAGPCNTISGNSTDGVSIVGATTRGDTIRGNAIYDNGKLGIDLEGDTSITLNDPADADSGANDLMNSPVGVSAYYDGANTTITGILDTTNPAAAPAATAATIDVYANATLDTAGFDQGEQYLGSTSPDAKGQFSLAVSGNLPLPYVSATATSGDGSTSEFSFRTPLIFIPGISGSSLVDGPGGATLWFTLDPDKLKRLALYPNENPSAAIYAPDALRDVPLIGPFTKGIYGTLLKQLSDPDVGGYREYDVGNIDARRTTAGCDTTQRSNNPNLFVFAYDWRLGNAANAAKLKDYIGCIRKFYPGSPVDILAHSMGGLLSRRYILDNPPGRPTERTVNKLITIGTSWLGAPKFTYVLETGDFIGWGLGSTYKHILGSFTGAHELLNSRAYYALSARLPEQLPPLVEDGWDLNGNNRDDEEYGFDDMRRVMDSRYGVPPEFLPGTAGSTFHEHATGVGSQDDWRNDQTGVRYYHLVGVQREDTTVVQVRATYKSNCTLFGRGGKFCAETRRFMPVFRQGDGTVPLVSASRVAGVESYNAATARVIYFRGSDPGSNDDQVEHTNLNSNAKVIETVLSILKYGVEPSILAANRSPDGAPARQDALPAAAPANYVTIDGAAGVVVADGLGNSTAALPEGIAGAVPEVSSYVLGDNARLLTIPATGSYTVTFQTIKGPLAIEIRTGTGDTATQAIRYVDLALPEHVAAMIRITGQRIDALRYDGDANGSFETTVAPTVSVGGAQANDLTPPVVTIQAVRRQNSVMVTLSAQDPGSGVKAIYYSLEGTTFQPYQGQIKANASQTPSLYVFADDNVANRSTRLYSLALAPEAPDVHIYLPAILKQS